jgi:RND family efflux transporter MFP subunit
MASRTSGLAFDLAAISSLLLENQEVVPRARILANTFVEVLPGTAVVLYTLADAIDGKVWNARAVAGEGVEPDQDVPFEAGTLGSLAGEQKVLIYSANEVAREEYAHLNVRRTIHSLVYLPIFAEEQLIGAVEIASFEGALDEAHTLALQPLTEIAGPALAAALAYEEERQNALRSISRLTQFYDVEKVFSATLEMNSLLALIASKVRETLECEAVNVWLVTADESLLLLEQSGLDPTVNRNDSQGPGGGIAGDVSDNGDPALISDPQDQRLLRRCEASAEHSIFSLIAAPLLDQGALVGVVEAINKLDGSAFDEDDLFVLTSLNETASTALHNAGLLLAERKVEILETLVTVSHEITSTLNLERMLQTIVNAPQAVIPYERAAIALEQSGKYRLSAVTGMTSLNLDAPDIAALNELLRWAMLSEEIVDVRQRGDEIQHSREETRAKFEKYFAESDMRAFYAIPLTDDTGRLGVLGMESRDPDFLSTAHLEILQVLAGQATVALRNAQMYKEIPFISLLEPVLEKKRKFLAIEKKKRRAILAGIVAGLVFLIAFPLPLRVEGDAVVAPLRSAQVQPEVEGVISKVYVREGQQVAQGQVMAAMADWEYRAALAGSEAKYQTAVLQMNRSLAGNDAGEAGLLRTQAEYWKSEVDRAQQLLDATTLRSPIDGAVATAHVENMTGRRLRFGDSFAEVVDTSRAVVDVAIDAEDAGLLRAGNRAAVKLNSYPTRTFRGDVAVVSPKGEVQGDMRVFFARVSVPNSDGAIRAGMEGHGKVRVNWSPAGYVLLRRPAMWLYSHLWNWFGL